MRLVEWRDGARYAGYVLAEVRRMKTCQYVIPFLSVTWIFWILVETHDAMMGASRVRRWLVLRLMNELNCPRRGS